jgi:hypothetical protein
MSYQRFDVSKIGLGSATVATVSPEKARSVANVASVASQQPASGHLSAEDWQAAHEERAAIFEHDGGAPVSGQRALPGWTARHHLLAFPLDHGNSSSMTAAGFWIAGLPRQPGWAGRQRMCLEFIRPLLALASVLWDWCR